MKDDVLILGIESSCDETAAAVVKNGRMVLSNVISSQIELHKLYGGVVPEIASRKHIEKINQVIEAALEEADVTLNDIDAIAVTYGPGLVGALLVGVAEAKAISFATNKPLVGVHHIEGHVSANYIEHPELEPPFLCLIVSGGHTHLVMVNDYGKYEIIGRTRDDAAGEAFEKIAPGKRFLMFSRSSYVGMHRYGGIWMGDNKSWWSHILLNLKMLPSLNMCGFLYTGADLGGFGADTTRDLVLRWLALGVFTPLMRNHSALGTREQEAYQFENIEDFRHVIGVRYRLVPYLYSEYMKAALNDDMMFRPLAFDYTDDAFATQVEDQLLLGNEIMIAPVYTQNAKGRYVYLPEEMMFVKFLPDGTISQEILEKGHHYVEVALNEVPLFIRKGKAIPVADVAQTVKDIDPATIRMIGYEGAEYDRYDDDGVSAL